MPEANISSIFLISVLYTELIRNVVRNVWNTVQKATEKHTHARNRERSDCVRGIFRKDTPRMTAHILVNELYSFL